MKKQEIKVQMVYPENPNDITRIYTQTITEFIPFDRELKISPKSNATINKAGFKVEFFVDTVSVLIGIGKDYSADLIMTKDAWEAFIKGEEVSITTVKEFADKYIKKRRVIKDKLKNK